MTTYSGSVVFFQSIAGKPSRLNSITEEYISKKINF